MIKSQEFESDDISQLPIFPKITENMRLIVEFLNVSIPPDLDPDQIYQYLIWEVQEKPLRREIWINMSNIAEELDQLGSSSIRDLVSQMTILVCNNSTDEMTSDLPSKWTVTQAAVDYLSVVYMEFNHSDQPLVERNTNIGFYPSESNLHCNLDPMMKIERISVEFFHLIAKVANMNIKYPSFRKKCLDFLNTILDHPQPAISHKTMTRLFSEISDSQTLLDIQTAIQKYLGPDTSYLTAIIAMDLACRRD